MGIYIIYICIYIGKRKVLPRSGPIFWKRKNDMIVDEMVHKNEIPPSVSEFLKGGHCEVATFYHLLKTHKIPPTINDPS